MRLLQRLRYDEIAMDDEGNVIGWISGSGQGPTLMINGHLDHVPPGLMKNPYSGDIVDGARWGEPGPALYGRGSCDMKCAVVAAAYAGGLLRQASVRLGGDFVLVADVAEEIDSPKGIQHVLATGIRADFGISAEATSLNVYVGHRGKAEYEVTAYGRSAHASTPERGLNSILFMARIISTIEGYAASLPRHPRMGDATAAITDIRAAPGGGLAVVPDVCTIRMERRWLPGESPERCGKEIREAIGDYTEEGVRIGLELVNVYPLMSISEDHPLVQAGCQARKRVLGDEGMLGAWRFGVNGTFMSQEGIPTIGLGPGSERWVHSPEEHIPVSEVLDAARLYAELARLLCS